MTMTGDVVAANADLFRRIWRGFGSTVALIATEWEGRRYAMLATAASSVSMEPPSLLICLNRSASAYDAVRARGAFSLGILTKEAQDIGGHIARSPAPERFDRGNWTAASGVGDLDGLPWLRETQGTLFCRTDMTTDYGTHTIFIAKVEAAAGEAGVDPLLYCAGRYGGFGAWPA